MRWPNDRRPSSAPVRRLGPPATALFVLAMMLVASLPAAEPPRGDGEGPVPATGAVLTVTDRREVVGLETFERIRVEGTGTLVIPSGASMTATSMAMEGDSRLEMTGGTLFLRGGPTGEAPSLIGNCRQVDLSRGSTISVRGGNGNTEVDSSAGAPALVAISAGIQITIADSTLEVLGGNGLSPERPFSSEGLLGDHCSGGDASLSLLVTGRMRAVDIRSSTIRVVAGRGGDAPDGLPGGDGGGYSDGGRVGGRVGAGGSAWLNLSSDNVFLDASSVTVTAGDGGDAGDGADVTSTGHGGGGGGYSGGAGGLSRDETARPGGRVLGDVGSGGDAWLMVQGLDYQQVDTSVLLEAGSGGNAGRGGDSSGLGGGGGGGYSGGGGGSDMEPAGAMGGTVLERVASGGRCLATMLLEEDVRMTGSTIQVVAGDGGDAGDGGASLGMAGGGGGGFSGGGGAGSTQIPGISGRTMYGGTGSPVQDQVASGGEARLRVNSSTGYLEGNLVTVVGGHGGDGGRAGRSWQDPDTDVWLGGGGGGSYSGGGGGGASEYSQDPRAGGQASPATHQVGDGGDGSLRLEVIVPTFHANGSFICYRGEKGLCWRSTAPGDTGGWGAGRFTRNGRAHSFVPMGRTELLGPPDGEASRIIPVFSWKPLHPSTTNGPVLEYSVDVAYDPSFTDPIHNAIVANTSYNFTFLRKGVLYWRVTPLYTRPHQRLGIPSETMVYEHLNAPPKVDEVPQLNVTVRVPELLDLHPYIHDVDDNLEDLRISMDSPDILWRQGMVFSFKFNLYKPPHRVYFNVSDGFDTTEGYIPMVVVDKNNDPALMGLGDYNPPVHITLEEGEELPPMKVRYYDRDGDKVTIRLITSMWDGIYMTDPETIVIKADFGDVGRYQPVIIAEDDRGGRSQMTLDIRVGNVGEPPDPPVFVRPGNGSSYHEGDAVFFDIGISDPDLVFGDTLNLTVISDISGVLFVGQVNDDVTFTTTDLDPGRHTITAVLVDGEFQERTMLDLDVEGDPESSNVWDPPDELWLFLGLLAVALGVMAVSYYAGYRRRKARARR